MSKIRRGLGQLKFFDSLKRLSELRIKVSHATLLEFSILVLILVLAFTVRLLPMRWGYYLSEFDTHWQYRLTKDIVENGYLHWTTWQDTMSWWPWGRPVAGTSFPGLPLTAATLYNVLNALGVPMVPSFTTNPLFSDPIYNFAVIFPVIMAVFTILAIYFLGKDIGGKEVGLFAAFFLALSSSFISRTSLGFFDDETVGIFGIVLFSLFFLRAIESERPLKTTLIYATAAGLSLGYLFASWGASRYPVGLALLFVGVLLLLRRYSTRLLISYSITFGIALFIAANVPKLGFGFLLEVTNLLVYGMLFLLCAFEINRHLRTFRAKGIFMVCFVVLVVGLTFALFQFGYARSLQGKYLSVLNPFERLLSPIVSSVQEHRAASWGSIYYDLGIGILFIPVGFYFAAQNPTNRSVYLILFGLTSIYFASSMVRLMLILAPALCLLWALALSRILRPFVTLLREAPVTLRRKKRFETRVGKEFSAIPVIIIFLLLTVTFIFPSTESRLRGDPFPRVIDQAYIPTSIAAAGLPVAIRELDELPDWLDALDWMRNNLPANAVVASWWDYGYWITTIANKTTLIDNATLNTSQIKRVGLMFMSPETEAIAVLDELNEDAHSQGFSSNVTYVAAFFTFDSNGNDLGYGEEGKWKWMANIAFDNLTAWKAYGNYTLGRDAIDADGDGRLDTLIDNSKGRNTTLYKLMMLGKKQRVAISAVDPQHFELIYWSQKGWPTVVTAGSIHALVTVWKVKP